jgi:hypothetical protein
MKGSEAKGLASPSGWYLRKMGRGRSQGHLIADQALPLAKIAIGLLVEESTPHWS